jgi:hypothetical protein
MMRAPELSFPELAFRYGVLIAWRSNPKLSVM